MPRSQCVYCSVTGPVEVELLPKCRERLRRRVASEDRPRRVTRQSLRRGEDDQRDDEQREHAEQEPAQNEPPQPTGEKTRHER